MFIFDASRIISTGLDKKMNLCEIKNINLIEAQESLERAKVYAMNGDIFREMNNLILSAALFREAGEIKKVKEVLEKILEIKGIPDWIKSEIEDEINNI